MDEQALSRHGTGLATSASLLGGQPAVSSAHTARGRHVTLTTAILAKTEHQVTQPTPLQAVSGAFSLSHA